ncbi:MULTISPECIES: hypothetical protein [Modestobacter]|uniref:Cobyrinic acid a,c-diamide synthase n=1 Tax=Modestobacter caceresii TaxID=1522368 RepID=A0A098Y6K9_9ACTN|nr:MULTISPECIES: hypothetical protein [Modestobacter]KGH45301.1 hypothetical protein IN07_17770 [Modestobacter caceresii]
MTRRPVLPGASELFRMTDTSAAAQPAPVTELTTLAATQSSPALRSNGSRADDGHPEPAPLALVPDVAGGAPRIVVDELASHRATMPAAAPLRPQQTRARVEKGRTRHEEKITVYCSADELLALETARLTLRGQHGVATDRGRIVREAIAVLLDDLEVHGENSVLVRRLRKH